MPNTIKSVNKNFNLDVELSKQVLSELIASGISEFCICPASRNSLFVYLLANSNHLPVKTFFWPEERSAAFFALGRIKLTGSPVAVIVTSGTAAGELLPAAMEAFYTGLPLVLVTADRPKRFRLSGAPQSVEQIGIYSHYVCQTHDLESGEYCSLRDWDQSAPIHLNICLEEAKDENKQISLPNLEIDNYSSKKRSIVNKSCSFKKYSDFIAEVKNPFVIVSALLLENREAVIAYLLALQAPVYLEASSGIREDDRLEALRITCIDSLWNISQESGYRIDGIIRIGGVPTARFWRDLENKAYRLPVCSLSELPFSGLSFTDSIQVESLSDFLSWAQTVSRNEKGCFEKWKLRDEKLHQFLLFLYQDEPRAEESLIHEISKKIPFSSKVYLGNSLPIREWDAGATYEQRRFKMYSNRGANGIDGQMATFFGCCSNEGENWGIFGDLTVLYDLVAPWILPQLSLQANIVVVNNGGGQIFAPMFKHEAFLNTHSLSFDSYAQFWNCVYEKWVDIPHSIASLTRSRIIELIPDEAATRRFYEKKKA